MRGGIPGGFEVVPLHDISRNSLERLPGVWEGGGGEGTGGTSRVFFCGSAHSLLKHDQIVWILVSFDSHVQNKNFALFFKRSMSNACTYFFLRATCDLRMRGRVFVFVRVWERLEGGGGREGSGILFQKRV